MKKDEAEQAIRSLVDTWATEVGEPWPLDSTHHYSFGSFWTWLEQKHHPCTQFRAVPSARYVAEMWFDEITLQAWRN